MSISNTDISFLNRCAQIAQLGNGHVSPNPMVGCVIVKDTEIIAEGYHQKYGGAHAEVNAINNLPIGIDYSLLTIYVSLEPCSHYGKTPPCSLLIAEKKFKRLVVSQIDGNELVSGKGAKVVEDAGIKVTNACLDENLNSKFDFYHKNKRPFITLKWAETKDGFMGRLKKERNLSKKISGKTTQILVHKERATHDAILIGMNTLVEDRPQLNNREFYGKQPTPVILCNQMLAGDYSYLSEMYEKVLLFSSVKQQCNLGENVAIIYQKNEDKLISTMLDYLYDNNIASILVEGGRFTLEQFISKQYYNKVIRIVGHQNWRKGVLAPTINLIANKVLNSGKDTISYYDKQV